ncbi:MAG: hypothetical protein NVSMB39_2330 [Candidatus Saccharimonadales bacterium]
MAAKQVNTQQSTYMAPLADALGPMIPFVTPHGGGNDEMTLGFKMGTREPFPFDPPQMMADGRISSMVAIAIADKNHGKTTLAKAVILRLGSISAGGRPTRIFADDHRQNHGVPEYRIMAQKLSCKEIEFEHKLNLFDPGFGLDISDYVAIAIDAYSHGNDGRPLEGHQQFALQIAVDLIFTKYRSYASINLLPVILRSMTIKHVEDYYSKMDAELLADLELEEMPRALQKLAGKLTLDEAEFMRDANIVAERFVRLLKGDFGKKFGGRGSYADAMRQLAVFTVYSGLDDDVIALMQSFIWRVKKHAQQIGDVDFMYNIEVHDENYKLWNYLSYAQAMSDFIKQARAFSVFLLMLTHRLKDYSSVGEPGSKQRQLATNMIDDVAIKFLGRQSKKAASELAEMYDLAPHDEEMLKSLSPGSWGVIIGNEPIVYIDIPLTAIEAEVSASNAAVHSMLDRSKG